MEKPLIKWAPDEIIKIADERNAVAFRVEQMRFMDDASFANIDYPI